MVLVFSISNFFTNKKSKEGNWVRFSCSNSALAWIFVSYGEKWSKRWFTNWKLKLRYSFDSVTEQKYIIQAETNSVDCFFYKKKKGEGKKGSATHE